MEKDSYLKLLIEKQIKSLQEYYTLILNWSNNLDKPKIKIKSFQSEENRLKAKIENYEKILIAFEYKEAKEFHSLIADRTNIIEVIKKSSKDLQNKLDIKQNEIENELDKLKTKGRTKGLKSKWVEPRFIDFNV